MMGVDDRAPGIENFFVALCEPVFARIGVEPTL
jgi:hypothetical protein